MTDDELCQLAARHADQHWPALGGDRQWHVWRLDQGWRIAPEGDDLEGQLGFPCLLVRDDRTVFEESSSTPPDALLVEQPTLDGRNTNSVDCVRAVEANWRGMDAAAAPLADPRALGAPIVFIENWIGGELRPTTLDDIQARLASLGHGSSALIVSHWQAPGGRAYNAVNEKGVIRWVDGQSGETALWPPPYAGQVSRSAAIFVGSDGVLVSD